MVSVLKITTDKIGAVGKEFKSIINRGKNNKRAAQSYTPAQLERKQEVTEYLKTRVKKDVSNNTHTFNEGAGYVPLGEFVKNCGNNLAEIDQKFGVRGLVTYIQQGGNPSYKGIPTIISMDKFLLNNCSNGNSISLNHLYDQFGDLGLNLYKGKNYKLYVETSGLPGFQTCKLTKDGEKNLQVTAIARQFNFRENCGIWAH